MSKLTELLGLEGSNPFSEDTAEIVDAEATLDDRDRIVVLVRVEWLWAQNNPDSTNPHSGKHRLRVKEIPTSKRIQVR